MIERFLEFISEEGLCAPGDSVLLGVSGGMDSMTMSRLFRQSPFRYGIAHCNFGLRGGESDEDERFVKEYAGKCGVPFFSVRFNTGEYARERRISTQMAARELRYRWFEEIRQREGYDAVAVAHHLNDLVETMLINLVRGTGLAGMHGISPKKGKLIRPLLGFTREEIEAFANGEAIPYREESSNASDKYMRNRLRHCVVPVLKELNPRLEHTFANSARHFSEAEQLLGEQVNWYRHLLEQQDGAWTLDYSSIREMSAPRTVVYELLKPFGFNEETVQALLEADQAQPGKQFLSASHRAVKDRDRLIIVPVRKDPVPAFEELFEARVGTPEDTAITPDARRAFLDYHTLRLPLKVRYWQEGDSFQPLGMKGRKKLSDFFVDQKIPLHLKQRIPLLLSGDEIVWVAGYRIAEPFKITPATKKIYELRLKAGRDLI